MADRETVLARVVSVQKELGGVFMDMKILKSEKRLCTCCMEEHEVKTVLVSERATFIETASRDVISFKYAERLQI